MQATKMQMYTIGQVAKKYALSRSTLIYYDSIGVLSPSGRSESNYRLYSEDDLKRMERIQLFRRTGLSLDSIELLLESESSDLGSTLEQRLFAINNEIEKLHDQQKVILKILENEILEKSARVMTKDVWISILKAAGLDEEGMKNWHVEFEKSSPDAHQAFLESIGIEKTEIAAIRDWSRSEC
jgi:DNA-binding transcriptional MerR regulator